MGTLMQIRVDCVDVHIMFCRICPLFIERCRDGIGSEVWSRKDGELVGDTGMLLGSVPSRGHFDVPIVVN
jgi:hypothetical protein